MFDGPASDEPCWEWSGIDVKSGRTDSSEDEEDWEEEDPEEKDSEGEDSEEEDDAEQSDIVDWGGGDGVKNKLLVLWICNREGVCMNGGVNRSST